jgi:hypothetical protein
MVALGWVVALFTAFQVALSEKDKFPLTLGLSLVVASASIAGLLPYLERRDHRSLLSPLLAIGRREVARARALTPITVLVLGTAVAVSGTTLGFLALGQGLDVDGVFSPVALAAQLAPFVQLVLLANEIKVAHAEARRGDVLVAIGAVGAGFAIPLAANLSGLLARPVAASLAVAVGASLTCLASTLYQRRISLVE